MDNNGCFELVIQTGDPGMTGNGYLKLYESPDPHHLPRDLKDSLVFPDRKVEYNVYVYDTDKDGKQEIILSANALSGLGDLRIYEWEERLIEKWRSPHIQYTTLTKAIGDFNNDSQYEITASVVG